jgi:crotonobetainyl-CoA:carnitine CoA-transferase CaiB-like acyl-CoA transferase
MKVRVTEYLDIDLDDRHCYCDRCGHDLRHYDMVYAELAPAFRSRPRPEWLRVLEPAPTLGEQHAAILAEVGYTREEIDHLIAQGVV